MTKEDLYEALGEVKETHVEEAGAVRRENSNRTEKGKLRKRKLAWLGWGVVAACLCLAAGGVYCYKLEHPYPRREVKMSSLEMELQKTSYVIPKWEERKIYEQFTEVSCNGIRYSARKGVVPAKRLGALLGGGTATGFDEYAEQKGEDGIRHRNFKLYEIAGISTECAVAVQYEGDSAYYAAVNSYYRPETLGQFVEDLNLRELVSFGKAYYSYHKRFSGDYATVHFETVDSGKIWELLLSETEAENVYSDLDFERPKKVLGISVNIPLLGYENISLSVLEDGYIMTNILDTGKQFYIGEENTEAFVEYVRKECEGYEIVYVNDIQELENPEQALPTEAPVRHIITPE